MAQKAYLATYDDDTTQLFGAQNLAAAAKKAEAHAEAEKNQCELLKVELTETVIL